MQLYLTAQLVVEVAREGLSVGSSFLGNEFNNQQLELLTDD
jgi:hypothetical protein